MLMPCCYRMCRDQKRLKEGCDEGRNYDERCVIERLQPVERTSTHVRRSPLVSTHATSKIVSWSTSKPESHCF
jgi:hypothetical protein